MRVLWGSCVLAVIAASGCCPPPDPEDPAEVLPAAPAPAPPPMRPTPPALLSRMQRPVMAPPPATAKPEREMLKEPPLVPPARPKAEVEPKRETLAPPPPPPSEPAARLPDDVVLELLEGGRAAFVRCFKLAVKADPTVTSFKVTVHVELDAEGAITSASADAQDQALAGCLSRATGWLKFPATGKRVVVELPLFYRSE